MTKRISVCTVCRGRVLNGLHREGVDVARVCTRGREVRFDVSSEQCGDACECLRRMGLAYTVRRLGIEAAGAFVRRRPALLVTAILTLAALIVCSQFVWAVRIDCPEALFDSVSEEVRAMYASPAWRYGLDTAAIRYAIEGVDGVALASVTTRGVWLQVDVKASLPEGEVTVTDGPIVAACDCIVSRIVVERGRALVSVGDSVRRGDVLIAPEYLLDAEADVTVPTTAAGTVYGYVYPTAIRLYEERVFRTVRTGEARRTASVTVAGKTYGALAPSPFEQYEELSEDINLRASLPVVIKRVTYYETQTIEEFRPWEVAKEGILEECFAEIYNQMKKGDEILRKWCIIDNMGNVHRVRAYAQVEQQVGVYQ